jgi:hypothetical protein
MFCITTQKMLDHTVVTLDGWLSDTDVEEVHRALSSVTGPTTLNLSDLETCSDKAAVELRRWIDAGATCSRATPFMKMLLASKPGRTTAANTRRA